MKPTQITELFANIRKTFVSFFSILMFVALGVGIYLGISWVAPAFQNAAMKAFDEGAFHNVQIQFLYGLSDDDLQQLSEMEGVIDVEPSRQSFQTLTVSDSDRTVKVQSLGERIDTLSVVDGELPRAADEIAFNARAARDLGIGVGDTVTFEKDAAVDGPSLLWNAFTGSPSVSDGMRYLNNGTYTVTALVNSPEYLANSGSTYGYSSSASGAVDLLAWVVPDVFDASQYQGGYPIVNMRFDSLQNMNSFSDDYKQKSGEIEQRVAELGEGLAQKRCDDVRKKAQEQFSAGEIKLAQAKAIVAEAKRKANEANASGQDVNAIATEYLVLAIDASGMSADEKALYKDMIGANGVDAFKSIDGAEKAIAYCEQMLDAAKSQAASLQDQQWTVTGRSSNIAAAEVSLFCNVTNSLSLSMAALFVIVGLLVSYSAIGRIVHEQISQIGTKKALGLREHEITVSFFAYSALAVVAGAVIGTLVGFTAVEGIISNTIGGMFVIGDFPPFFGLGLFLIVTGLELALVLGATWLACHSILREQAVELLRGPKPPSAKTRFYEKWDVWKRTPLLTQTIVNNCANDKRRVFSTIVGVAGCTALIVTAVTLNDDVLNSYDRHYDDVYGFNAITYVDGSVDDAFEDVESVIQGEGGTTAQALRKSMILTEPTGERSPIRIIVPGDDGAFAQVYHVNPTSGGSFDPSADGVWVSQAYGEHFNAKVGDEIEITTGGGVTHKVPILGFYEFLLTYHEAIMGRDYYENEFDTEYAPNVVLADTGGKSVDYMEDALADIDGFNSISDDKLSQSYGFKQFAAVSRSVVLIYLALSTLMAIVVLLNLNVMFIEEKRRELIVLMINGFSVHDAKRYIYNDTIALTAIGIICGLALGCAMGAITVGSIEPSTAMFLKDIDPIAVAAGAVGSAVLSFVMSFIALRRIPRLDLTDINRF